MKIGFDCDTYIKLQAENITKRINQFDNKLYLEFGGKLFDDYHASRVIPGFQADSKIRILQKMADKTEIVICINSEDIEKNKIRADFGVTYDMDVLRLIDNIRALGLYVGSIVIGMFANQPNATIFKNKLEMRGERVYLHKKIPGYPMNVDLAVSDEGYGANEYIETTRPLVVVTAPGPGSGKLAACLSQLYHEHKRSVRAGYAKFETFPVWNLPLKHPVNLAYEAATADLNDVNMIDPFHLEAYGKTAVNYNRDIEVFPIVKMILSRVMDDVSPYKSPTDMGVNMLGYCITDDDCVREASNQEIIRRYYKIKCAHVQGNLSEEPVQKIELVVSQMNLSLDIRKPVKPAIEKAESSGSPSVALELTDGKIVAGRTTSLMNASASVLVNAVKTLAGIRDSLHLLSPVVLEPIQKLKSTIFENSRPILGPEEVLIALSICAATNPTIELAMSQLKQLRNCEAHSSHILPLSDEAVYRRLGINLTCEPQFPSKNLFQM